MGILDELTDDEKLRLALAAFFLHGIFSGGTSGAQHHLKEKIEAAVDAADGLMQQLEEK